MVVKHRTYSTPKGLHHIREIIYEKQDELTALKARLDALD